MIDQISEAIKSAILEAFDRKVDFVLVQTPEDKQFGDYSSNIAMMLAKELKQNPMEIAEKLVSNLKTDDSMNGVEISIAKPGFVNFMLGDDALEETTDSILREGVKNKEESHDKVIVEHTSVNPNKAMHVGHLRNSCIGDSLAKILKHLGHKVEIENYIDDTGVQVADGLLGVEKTNLDQSKYKKFDHFAWDAYTEISTAMEKDNSLEEERNEILKKIEDGDPEVVKRAEEFTDKILKDQLATMGDLGIAYNLLVTEGAIVHSGLLKNVLEKLEKSEDLVKETEGENKGAVVLKNVVGEGEKLQNPDKILVKSSGVATYTGKDVALHMWKFGLSDFDFKYRKFDDVWETSIEGEEKDGFGKAEKVVNVIDVRQSYPQEVVRKSLEKLGFENQAKNYKHVAYELVSLSAKTAAKLGVDTSDGKKEYPMSGRKGIGVKTDDFLEKVVEAVKAKQKESKHAASGDSARQVALGAIKFYMLKYGLNSVVAFDMDDALSFEGDTGPYVQYTHARIHGIIKKAGGGVGSHVKLETPEEKELARILLHYSEVVDRAGEKLEPIHICGYLLDLCHSFNSFYTKVPVIKAPEAERASRLALIKSVAVVLEHGLGLLGIEAPKSM